MKGGDTARCTAEAGAEGSEVVNGQVEVGSDGGDGGGQGVESTGRRVGDWERKV